LITKQVNCAIVCLAPLALLAGCALSRLGRSLATLVAVAVIIPLGIIGTALEQQVNQRPLPGGHHGRCGALRRMLRSRKSGDD
jgi:hypothetical protein